MNYGKKFLCMSLVVCALSMACVAGAAEAAVRDEPVLTAAGSSGSEIVPMSTSYAIRNAAITRNGGSWNIGSPYTAYAITVNNTTNQQMKVTVTGRSPTTFYVPANSSKSITKNNAASGIYRVSFSTASGALSGTFSVLMSTEALV